MFAAKIETDEFIVLPASSPSKFPMAAARQTG